MKKICLISFMTLCHFIAPAQTEMVEQNTFSKGKVWQLKNADNNVGLAYSINENANIDIQFYPNNNNLNDKALVLTGTYTSGDGKVAGNAFNNCNNVGNPNDAYFHPNAYITYSNGKINFSSTSNCNSIPVYKLVDDNNILTNIINQRTKNPMQWRFLIEKKWQKKYDNGKIENGVDWIIADFSNPLTLSQVAQYVAGLTRNQRYNNNFSYTSTINACLLDTGTFRPFKVDGNDVDGVFPQNQSNVLVVN